MNLLLSGMPYRYCLHGIVALTCCSILRAAQPYTLESAANDSDVLVQAQLDGTFEDQSQGRRNLRAFGNGVGNFQFEDSGLPEFGKGLRGYEGGENGNGTNFILPPHSAKEFTVELVVTILPGFQSSGLYGLAARDELNGSNRYFQFYKNDQNQLESVVFDSSGEPHYFSASDTPDLVEGHTYFLAEVCDGKKVSFYAADLTQHDPLVRLKMSGSEVLNVPVNETPGDAPLIMGDKGSHYLSPALHLQFDFIRYSTKGRQLADIKKGLSLDR